jgi:hypothetical protein
MLDDIAWAKCSVAQADYAAERYSEAAFRDSLVKALAQSTIHCAARLAV